MSYPGPWVQGDDYQRDEARNGAAGMTGSYSHSYPGPAPYDDEMNDATGAVEATTPDYVGLQASVAVTSAWRYETGAIDLTASKEVGGAFWNADRVVDLNYYYNTYLLPLRPADAVGIEYEANTAAVVGAALHVVVQAGGAQDTTAPSGVAPNAAIDVVLSAGATYDEAKFGPALVEYIAPTAAASYDFDVTPYMGPLGEVALSVRAAKSGDWSYYNPGAGGLISARTNLTPGVDATRVIYTLHPPRHRWLYATPVAPPGLPPLRQSPRDDNLGTASAARIWPPPSSRQGGLRRLGGVDC